MHLPAALHRDGDGQPLQVLNTFFACDFFAVVFALPYIGMLFPLKFSHDSYRTLDTKTSGNDDRNKVLIPLRHLL